MFVEKSSVKSEKSIQEDSFNRDEVSKMLREALADERRKISFDDKMEAFEAKIKEVNRVIYNQEENMTGMNEEFKNAVNHQINPKLKKLESSVSSMAADLDPARL